MKTTQQRVNNSVKDSECQPSSLKHAIIGELNSSYMNFKLLQDYSGRLGEDSGIGPAEAFGIVEIMKDLAEHQQIMPELPDRRGFEFVERNALPGTVAADTSSETSTPQTE